MNAKSDNTRANRTFPNSSAQLRREKEAQLTANTGLGMGYAEKVTDFNPNPTLLEKIEAKEEDLTQRLNALRLLKLEVKETGIIDQMELLNRRFHDISSEY